MTDATAAPAFQGFGTKTYRAYVLGVLLVIYTFNFIDRILIGVVQEAIKEDFQISNFYLGLLGGPAFAILYTAIGIPIARFAERGNRITIVAIGAALWSVMTAACGFAANFIQLALCRVGVGIGEAACTPPSHSAISDYFPASRRASALAIYGLGIPIGTMFAAVGGGWLNQNFDWRTAFIMLGVPGVLAALVLKLTVKEPPRAGGAVKAPTFGATFAFLSKKSSFWHVAFAGALMSFFGYASAQFLVSLFVRNFELGPTLRDEIAYASYAFGVIGGGAVGLGTFLGGFLADRFGEKHKSVLGWLPAIGIVVAVPLYALSYLLTDFFAAFALIFVAAIFHYLYIGPMFATTQAVCEPRMRATGAALQILIVNLIGYGLGPPLIGFANDFYAGQLLAAQGLTLAQCADAANAAACASAQAVGLKYALATGLIALVWAAFHFLWAGRTIARDRVS
jgi:MFS family permease